MITVWRAGTAHDIATSLGDRYMITLERPIANLGYAALALTGAVVEKAGGYLAAIGFFRTKQLDQYLR